MKPAADCGNMSELRAEIDRVDRAVVTLLAERQSYIERAAVLKPSRDVVHDDARIADVISKVLAEAAKAGLRAEIAEPVWRVLIARSIAHEFETFDKVR